MIHRLQIDVIDTGGNEADRVHETNWNTYTKHLVLICGGFTVWSLAMQHIAKIYQASHECRVYPAITEGGYETTLFMIDDVRTVMRTGVAIERDLL